MNWYWYVIIVLSLYIISVIVKVIILTRYIIKEPMENFQTIEEAVSIAIGNLYAVIAPWWWLMLLKHKISENKTNKILAKAYQEEHQKSPAMAEGEKQ